MGTVEETVEDRVNNAGCAHSGGGRAILAHTAVEGWMMVESLLSPSH